MRAATAYEHARNEWQKANQEAADATIETARLREENERLRSMEAALKHALAVMDSLDVYNVYKVTRNEARAALAGGGKEEG